MNKLKEKELDKFIIEKINKKIPSLFICVGMQFFSHSFEFGNIMGSKF